MTDHLQVPGKHPKRGTIMVDEKMVGLLELLWNNGVDTYFSCQGGPTKRFGMEEAYIMLGKNNERKEVQDFMAWLPGIVSLKPHWKNKLLTRQIMLDRVGYYAEYVRYSGSLCLRLRSDMIDEMTDLLSSRLLDALISDIRVSLTTFN